MKVLQAPARHTCGRDGVDGCIACRDRILRNVASQRRGSAGRALDLAEANRILANARNPYHETKAKAFDEYVTERKHRLRVGILSILAGGGVASAFLLWWF